MLVIPKHYIFHKPLVDTLYKFNVNVPDPTGPLKPFPFAVNGGSSNSKVPYAPPAVHIVNYDTPPEWYTGVKE
jgi:hypothetical protein